MYRWEYTIKRIRQFYIPSKKKLLFVQKAVNAKNYPLHIISWYKTIYLISQTTK